MKSNKWLTNTLRAVQCLAAIGLIYLILCAVFRSLDCKLNIPTNNPQYVDVNIKVTPKLFSNSFISFKYYDSLLLPKSAMKPEDAKNYEELAAGETIYSRSSLAKVEKRAVMNYNLFLGIYAFIVAIIGLIPTGIKYMMYKKQGC